MAASAVRERVVFPYQAHALCGGGFASPEQPALPVKSLSERGLLLSKKGCCNNRRPHHPCHSSFGRAEEAPRWRRRRRGERASSKKTAWRNLWPAHTFPIHLHLMPLIFQQLQCQGQTEILHSLFHSEMSVSDLLLVGFCCFFLNTGE